MKAPCSVREDVAPLIRDLTAELLFEGTTPGAHTSCWGLTRPSSPEWGEKEAVLWESLQGGMHSSTQQLVNVMAQMCAEAVPSRDSSHLRGEIEEALLSSPAVPTVRVVFEGAVRLGAVDIPDRAQVFVLIAAANMDVAEGNGAGTHARHLTFSHGPHRCIGSQVARAQADVLVRLVFESFAGCPTEVVQGAPSEGLSGPADVLIQAESTCGGERK